ncbi:MAG: lycopene cyclase domain-containing protein [Bacteroidetes bacterium]|nr:lycopene cyclase domain-containing protein [Bacteroidota bacterium]
MRYLYMGVDFGTIIIPLIFSFHKKIRFNKYFLSFYRAAFLVALVFLLWDATFTKIGIWSFNDQYVIGFYILGLPIEEILFFFCIPFSCVFTYFCLDRFYNLKWRRNVENICCIVLSIGLIIVGLIFLHKRYTSVTFISTGIICFALQFIFRVAWFGKAVTVYAILLIPFLIVNGVLTGTGIPDAVVYYNNAENLNLRILTIPIEDVFYGFEMFLLNLLLFKYFAKMEMGNIQFFNKERQSSGSLS